MHARWLPLSLVNVEKSESDTCGYFNKNSINFNRQKKACLTNANRLFT